MTKEDKVASISVLVNVSTDVSAVGKVHLVNGVSHRSDYRK